jgi:hypothetical protein
VLAELPEVSSCLNRLVLEQLEISEQYLTSDLQRRSVRLC